MEKLKISIQLGIVTFLVCSAMLIAGCGVMVIPNNIPLIKNVEIPKMNGVTLIVVNVEKDSSDYQILNDKGQNLGLVANKHMWSKKLVESLAGELAKRGAYIRANSSLTLSIALPKIVFNQIGDMYQFKIETEVSTSTGWSKNYMGIAETGLGYFESMNSLVNRLAGLALGDAVKTMLNDADFLAQISGKK